MLKRVDPVFIYMPVFHRQMAPEDAWTRKTSATSTSYEVLGGGRHLYHQQTMFALSRSQDEIEISRLMPLASPGLVV